MKPGFEPWKWSLRLYLTPLNSLASSTLLPFFTGVHLQVSSPWAQTQIKVSLISPFRPLTVTLASTAFHSQRKILIEFLAFSVAEKTNWSHRRGYKSLQLSDGRGGERKPTFLYFPDYYLSIWRNKIPRIYRASTNQMDQRHEQKICKRKQDARSFI